MLGFFFCSKSLTRFVCRQTRQPRRAGSRVCDPCRIEGQRPLCTHFVRRSERNAYGITNRTAVRLSAQRNNNAATGQGSATLAGSRDSVPGAVRRRRNSPSPNLTIRTNAMSVHPLTKSKPRRDGISIRTARRGHGKSAVLHPHPHAEGGSLPTRERMRC